MQDDHDQRRNWALGSDHGDPGRGADSEESTGYEADGYGSDFDFEGAGGYESRGGYARGGGDLGPEYRDIPPHYGRELLDWDTYGRTQRGRGGVEGGREGSRRIRSFRGVGPKGWSRPDQSIEHDVCEALQDADVDVSGVSVDVIDGLVELTGTMDDRWAKRYVEDVAYAVRGVRDVRNRIELA